MDKKEKFQIIKGGILDILQVVNQMEDGEIKQIDVDLLKLKFADVYNEVLTLMPEKESGVGLHVETEIQKEAIVSELEKKEPVETISEVADEKVTETKPQAELNLDFKAENDEENKTEAETKPYVPEIDFVRENEPENRSKKTIGESFQKGKTLNDLVSEIKKEKESGAGLNFLKINNLLHAISINDKIEFVRELFNNNADKYAEIVSKLNEENNLDSAIYILTEVDFDNDKPAAKKFLNLVYRRFMNA